MALAVARAHADLTSAALDSAARRLAVAERQTVNTDTELASALVPFVESVLPGVTPTVLPFRPKVLPTDLPCAVIVQSAPSTHDRRSGHLSGAVQVLYFRTRTHLVIEAGDFEREAQRHDHGVTLSRANGHSEALGEVEIDTIRLSVYGALPAVPEVDFRDTQTVADAVAAEIAYTTGRSSHYTSASTSRMPMDTGQRIRITTSPVSARVLDDKRDGDLRRLTVEASVHAAPATHLPEGMGVTHSECAEAVAKAAESLRGRSVPRVGNVETVTIVGRENEEGSRGRPTSAWTVTVRASVMAKVPALAPLDDEHDDDWDEEFDESGVEIAKRSSDFRDVDPLDSHPGSRK
jgi:hypothetical protein